MPTSTAKLCRMREYNASMKTTFQFANVALSIFVVAVIFAVFVEPPGMSTDGIQKQMQVIKGDFSRQIRLFIQLLQFYWR